MTQAYEPTPVEKMCGELNIRIIATLKEKTEPTAVLQWLADQPSETVKQAIKETQPKAFAVAIEPLIESLTEDQRRGFIVALIAVYSSLTAK